jgi:fructuronate reductase
MKTDRLMPPLRVLSQDLLNDTSFWRGKQALLPLYDRVNLPVTSVSFSAGRMAYGHTGDILQDLLNQNLRNDARKEIPRVGLMVGVETFAMRYVAELAASDYLVTQLIYENEKGVAIPKIQGAIKTVLMVDDNTASMSWQRMMELARDPRVQFATINAPEGAYGVTYAGGDFAEPQAPNVKKDLEDGSALSDPGKWTAFALERFKAQLPFAMVSCTNFSGNGQVTGGTLRLMARAWEKQGRAPKGFLAYLSDPARFSFPNTMIDRIAVPPDEIALAAMDKIGVRSNVVVTEKVRYWAVEDRFPAGRPPLEDAEGVFMCPDHEDVKRYEGMKLRILNMSHSIIAGLGVLLGYRGKYGVYRAMQDKDVTGVIFKILDLVMRTVERPKGIDPRDFAKDTIIRLNNANIPDDPMRIAFHASTKMKFRFMDTYYAAQKQGIPDSELAVVLLPIAGFLRYTVGIDDQGVGFALEDDPIKARLAACGAAAALGDPSSATAFKDLISDPDVMGKDLYAHGNTGRDLERLVGKMLKGPGAVRATVSEALS